MRLVGESTFENICSGGRKKKRKRRVRKKKEVSKLVCSPGLSCLKQGLICGDSGGCGRAAEDVVGRLSDKNLSCS